MGKIKEMKETTEYLKELGFNISSVGFNYWVLAVDLYNRNFEYGIVNMTNIYEEIAEIYHTTKLRVERAMRTARNTANENISKEFNYNGKITNLSCLKLLVM